MHPIKSSDVRVRLESHPWHKSQPLLALGDLSESYSYHEEELIEYLIDGIPDHSLQNHAKLQKFKSQASLLEAFREVTLQPTPGNGTRFGVDKSWRRNTVWHVRKQ